MWDRSKAFVEHLLWAGEKNGKWVKHSTCLEYSLEVSSETDVSKSREKWLSHTVSSFAGTGTNYPGH